MFFLILYSLLAHLAHLAHLAQTAHLGHLAPPITQSLFSTADAACTAGSIVVTLVVATK